MGDCCALEHFLQAAGLAQALQPPGQCRAFLVGPLRQVEVLYRSLLFDLPLHLPIATSHVKALEVLRDSDVDWTYVAPAAFFEPGTRTGKFRSGTNKLITAANGESRISMEDYAIAMVDELESGANRRQRVSVGY